MNKTTFVGVLVVAWGVGTIFGLVPSWLTLLLIAYCAYEIGYEIGDK